VPPRTKVVVMRLPSQEMAGLPDPTLARFHRPDNPT
jgi:hypothetical protein